MYKTQTFYYTAAALLPPALTLILWLSYGLPEPATLTVTVYHTQLLMTAVTIVSIPLLLKYVTTSRCGARYSVLCLVRMLLLCVIAGANVALYFFYCSSTTFFYLGVMAWLAMFFAFPKNLKDKNDTHIP